MAEPLKNHFDRQLVELLADRFERALPTFDTAAFTSTLLAGFPERELKDRINLVADTLQSLLPGDYPTAVALVVEVAGSDDVDGFAAWPLCSFVERHGLTDPATSFAAMERLTRRFSCEFAVRPFLEHHLEPTLDFLRGLIDSDDETVRRLPSEGTRPRLPWGPKVAALTADPEIGIALITPLRHDPSETVRRSVANHLNDIARDHPLRVVEIAAEWSRDDSIDPAMIRHALRTLVKQGHPGALRVLGFTTEPSIEVESFTVTPREIGLGESIELEATLRSAGVSGAQRLVVDFRIHHVGSNGTNPPKVFKWAIVELQPEESVTLTKRRRIATASTRRYHAGEHKVEVQVAGAVRAATSFILRDGSD